MSAPCLRFAKLKKALACHQQTADSFSFHHYGFVLPSGRQRLLAPQPPPPSPTTPTHSLPNEFCTFCLADYEYCTERQPKSKYGWIVFLWQSRFVAYKIQEQPSSPCRCVLTSSTLPNHPPPPPPTSTGTEQMSKYTHMLFLQFISAVENKKLYLRWQLKKNKMMTFYPK